MKSQAHGKNTLRAEVQGISPNGIWLYVIDREYFLPFKEYPWFENARVADIYNVALLQDHHLHWVNLDIDLELESLEQSKNYPLIYR
ncbi:MAG: DUF2442 domain-containing protein [Deltaproteobacteria bacterium]|nr:DUF2442 domain-containing protein [Deltaproteobacteria bacterium]